MRTNIDIDEDLVAEAARLTGVTVKRALVDLALRALVDQRRRISVLELANRDLLDPSYDYKAARVAGADLAEGGAR